MRRDATENPSTASASLEGADLRAGGRARRNAHGHPRAVAASRSSSTTSCSRRSFRPRWAASSPGCSARTPMPSLNFAVAAVAVIAIVGAVSSYFEKYLTTSVSQWVAHDLRRTLYHHIQRLSLAEHDERADRRPDHARHQRHRRRPGLHQLRAARHARRRDDAGRHDRRHVLSQLALHAHRALGRAGALSGGVLLHAAHQERLARRAKTGGRAALHRGGSADVHPRGQGLRAGGLRTEAIRHREPGQRGSGARGPKHQGQAGAARGSDRRHRHLPGAVVRGTAGDGRAAQRRRADRLPVVSGQDVQADARSLEDDRHGLQGDGRLRAHPGSAGHRKPRARRAGRAPGAEVQRPDRIRPRHLQLRHRQARSLKDVSFTIEAGQVAAIVGPSGTGKTTHRQPDSALLRSGLRVRAPSTGRTFASTG